MSERLWTKEEWERQDGPRDHTHPITAATLDHLYGLCAEQIRQSEKDRAAIRDMVEALATGATYPKSERIAWWREKHAAAIARATGQEGAKK